MVSKSSDQADLKLWWSHIPHSWKSHVVAHMLKQKKIIVLQRETLFIIKHKACKESIQFSPCSRIMTCCDAKLDLVNMNAYIKFGEILPIGSQYIERKRNFGVNKGP